MKCLVLLLTLFVLLPLSVRADYIFEQAYEYVVGYWPWDANCLVGGDFNNDALTDFVASYYPPTGEDTYLFTFQGNGDCTFDILTTEVFTYTLGSITVNDFDNDGCADLIIGEGNAYYGGGYPIERDIVHLFKGNGDGTFTELDTLHVKNIWVTSGDLNNDGNIDLVISGSESGDCAVLVKPGNGDFTFQETASYVIPIGILHTVQILGDMDLDGNVDIGVIGYSEEVFFLYGNGDGTFQPAVVVAEHAAQGCFDFIGVGDFNEDGMPDMAVTGSLAMCASDKVLVWDGSGTFPYDSLDRIGNSSTWIEINDFDMDGHLDIAMSKFCDNGYVLPGYGNGHFPCWYQSDSLLLETVAVAYSVLSADFDLDGDFDLIFCEDAYGQHESIRCYRNTTITQGFEEESAGLLSDLNIEISPNPFSSSVSIEVSGYSNGSGNLQIFDLSGRLIIEFESVPGGEVTAYYWSGVSSSGVEVPAGIYTARLCAENQISNAMLLKLE